MTDEMLLCVLLAGLSLFAAAGFVWLVRLAWDGFAKENQNADDD